MVEISISLIHSMDTPVKRTKADICLNLMVMSGMMLVVLAIPIGMTLTLQSYFQIHQPIYESTVIGVSMLLVMVFTGVLLYRLGLYLLKRRRKTERIKTE